MKSLNTTLCLVFLTVLTGCQTQSYKINRLALGMPEAEVIERLGKPAGRGIAKDGTVTLHYTLRENDLGSINAPYFVRIVESKVESFGREGAPTTTRPPTAIILPAR